MNRRALVFLAAAVTVTAVSSCAGGVPAAPPGSATAAASPPAARGAVGTAFGLRDSSGGTYQVTLVKVIDPAQGADQYSTPDSGRRLVGAVFTIRAVTGSPARGEDANNDAVIVGGNGQTYTAATDAIAGYANFSAGTIQVALGDTATGAVTFQVPDGVRVAKVQWAPSIGFASMVQWDVQG